MHVYNANLRSSGASLARSRPLFAAGKKLNGKSNLSNGSLMFRRCYRLNKDCIPAEVKVRKTKSKGTYSHGLDRMIQPQTAPLQC